MRQGVFNRLDRLASGTATVALLLLAGCAASMNSTVEAPVFTPAGGSFTTAQTVTVSATTPGAVLHCTTDGSTPTASSPVCTQPVTVYKSETLSAVAVAAGATSAVSTAAFTIALPAAATPVISPSTGTYVSVQSVTISDATPGAIIYYTVDGSAPTSSSAVYGGPITVASTQTIRAIAVSSATTVSDVASATFTINLPAPTPVISPAGGTFSSIQTVTISDAAAGATIYYTLDGSVPSPASTPYSGPITVAKSETIMAIAAAPGSSLSAVASATFTLNLPSAATPIISPPGGAFAAAQTVTLTDSTTGASIYFTVDGSVPTTSSTLYIAPVNVSTNETIQAIAVAPGYNTSAVASAAFTVAAPLPVISPAGGTFTKTQTVTITDSAPSSTIYYTVDGSVPTSASTPYTAPISVATSQTIKAIATGPSNSPSAVASASFTINLGAAAVPIISPPGGTFTSSQKVTITDASPDAVIYYTTDGTVPTTNASQYFAPFDISASTTVKAIATAPGFSTSAVASASFTFNQAPAATPTISPAGGTFTTAQTVTLSDSTAGATIYYTTDGSTPSTLANIYFGPFTVSEDQTVKAIAAAPGFNNSAVATAAFVINLPAAATPVFTPAGGTFAGSTSFTLSDSTAGATVYYTTDGTTPTTASTVYDTAVIVSASETVKAIATASGFSTSAVATAVFVISAATPVISPDGGTFTAAQTVTITDSTTDAVVYYTVDGSVPTAASTKYTAPFTVSATTTVKAIAIAAGVPDSPVATATFTISTVAGMALSGTVTSGSTPISGASVQLYAAGMTGYGSTPTPLLTTPVTTSSTGGFVLGFNSCPAAPGDQLYVVATGGDAGHGANAGIALMIALGSCANITSGASVTINEATTVASAYALAQFASVATGGGVNIGAPAPSATCFSSGAATCNYVGLQNAFKNVPNLVDAPSGAVLTITPFYATNTVPYLNSSTVPQARINTLADVLASCVGATSAAGCPNLYTAATPSGGAAPADTLQAVLSIAQNPGQNVAALYGLIAATPPYTPILSAAPNDFALALTFTGGGLGIKPGQVEKQIINHDLDIDAAGNVWVVGFNAKAKSNMIAKFNSGGDALTPATTQTTARFPVTTYGGYAPQTPDGTAAFPKPSGIAIDQSGNAWVNAFQPAEVSSALSLITSNLGNSLNITDPRGVAIDTLGDVLFTALSSVYKFDSSGNLLTQTPWDGKSSVAPQGYNSVRNLLFDSTGNTLWASDQDGNGDLYQINPANGQITVDYVSSNPATENDTTLVADNAGNIYGCSSGAKTSLDVFNASSTSIINSYPIAGGRGCGDGPMVIDGDGHIFTNNSTSTKEFFDELTTTGVLISPTAMGYSATSGDEASVFNTPQAAAIDSSGSLWTVNYSTGTVGSPNNVLVQLIGIAAPVVTPKSLALQNNELATRP